MTITTRKGLNLPLIGDPEPIIGPGREITTVALMGDDYIGMRPTMLVQTGDRVRLGQPLFADKKNPGIHFTAPGCGEVIAINRGARRALQSVVIRLDGDDEETFESYSREELASLSGEQVRENLLASGLWAALRTRPLSKIPARDGEPEAIFVTAIDTNPLAGPPEPAIAEQSDSFADGLAILAHLTPGKIHVCTAANSDIAVPEHPQVERTGFEGPHPVGLVGTHIHFLHPVNAESTVWHLGYQDVIAIGKLFTTGRIWTERVVSLAGPMVARPRLVRTRLGANTEQLVEGELEKGECRVVSGSVLSGRRAAGWAHYLRRYHIQISVIPESQERRFLDWLRPGFNRYSFSRTHAGSAIGNRLFALSTSQNGSPRAMVPIGNFESIMPLDLLPTPLLKALLVRDTDTAQLLGCLELDEEDLALCSFVCCSKYEYGAALRASLTIIEKEG